MSNAIEVGDWVVAGEGDELDMGRIVKLNDEDYAPRLIADVAWSSGNTTNLDLTPDDVEIFGSRKDAEERYAERNAVLTVEASNARPTALDVSDGCVDVDVIVRYGSVTLHGEVTLGPSHSGALGAYGDCPDTWVSGDLLRELYALPGKLCTTLDAVESAAAEAAGRMKP
jgi:hypothetical protein